MRTPSRPDSPITDQRRARRVPTLVLLAIHPLAFGAYLVVAGASGKAAHGLVAAAALLLVCTVLVARRDGRRRVVGLLAAPPLIIGLMLLWQASIMSGQPDASGIGHFVLLVFGGVALLVAWVMAGLIAVVRRVRAGRRSAGQRGLGPDPTGLP